MKFTHLYSRYGRPIQDYVLSRIGNVEVSRELAQEVFLKAFRFQHTYREQYSITTWLWTIAKNTVTDYLRSPSAAMALPAHPEPFHVDHTPCPKPDAENIFATSYARKQKRRSLLRLARKLTWNQKRVLWLQIVHELSHPEIARKLGLSLAAVKNLAYRGRITLLRQQVFYGDSLA